MFEYELLPFDAAEQWKVYLSQIEVSMESAAIIINFFFLVTFIVTTSDNSSE